MISIISGNYFGHEPVLAKRFQRLPVACIAQLHELAAAGISERLFLNSKMDRDVQIFTCVNIVQSLTCMAIRAALQAGADSLPRRAYGCIRAHQSGAFRLLSARLNGAAGAA
jgi:hypothetical protein